MASVEALAPHRYIVVVVYAYRGGSPIGEPFRMQAHARETMKSDGGPGTPKHPALHLFVPEEDSFTVINRLVQRYGTSSIRLAVLYKNDAGEQVESEPMWRLAQYQKVNWT